MSACTFFGHRNCYPREDLLRAAVENCMINHHVTVFYVGQEGNFDAMALAVLKEVKKEHTHITYWVVPAYMPTQGQGEMGDTMLPDGIETVPPRYAIFYRNRWMLQRSDYVIAYITHSFGGAAKFTDMAKRRGKTVLNIAN